MTAQERENIKIEFAPGAFDSFDGTQEELDSLMAEIKNMILNGSLFERSRTVDIDELMESDDPEDRAVAEKLLNTVNMIDANDRKLQ